MNTEKESIKQALTDYIKSNILAPGIAFESTTLFAKCGVDSYSVIEIILFIEREFGIIIPDTELISANLASVDALTECVYRLQQKI